VRLSELQSAFHALATGGPRPTLAAGDFLVGTPGLSAADRVGIYASMYLVRQVDALREAFPATSAVLGASRFTGMVEHYVLAHPSESPDLNRLGRRLAAFLRAHPEHAARPDVPDLAALEWARTEAFYEAEGVAVGRRALGAIPPQEFAGTRLRFVPALRLVRFQRDPLPLWRALEDGQDLPAPAPGPGAAAVWRPALDVVHARLPAEEAEALAWAMAGASLEQVCDAFATSPAPAEAAFAALASWVDEQWVAGVGPPPR
jgi:hypothetical protein